MTRIAKRGLRNLASMALSGTPEVDDAEVILGISLTQLRLSVAGMLGCLDSGGLDRDDLQSQLIGLQSRLQALEDFADQCLAVSFLPLDEDQTDDQEPAVAS